MAIISARLLDDNREERSAGADTGACMDDGCGGTCGGYDGILYGVGAGAGAAAAGVEETIRAST